MNESDEANGRARVATLNRMTVDTSNSSSYGDSGGRDAQRHKSLAIIITLCFATPAICLSFQSGTKSTSASVAASRNLVRFVDPIIGTAGGGNTIPAIGYPFGMTQWTPQTSGTEAKCQPPYVFTDTMFSGFRGTHWLSGSCTQDYGSFTLMPITGELTTTLPKYQAGFSHRDEMSTPYYYRVLLRRYDLTAEVTSTVRCAMMRFTASEGGDFYLLVSPNSDRGKGYIKVDPGRNEIVGYNPAYRIYQGTGQPAGFSGYFVVQLDKAFDSCGTFAGGHLISRDSLSDLPDLGAYIHYRAERGEHFLVRVGTSFTSIREARRNLSAEIPNWDFESVSKLAAMSWEDALGRIRLFGGTLKDRRIFYTALYHTMQQPRLFSDCDGSYPVFSRQYETGKLKCGSYYDDFSMWDIFRAEIPLYELLSPELVDDWVRSIIMKGEAGGWLPIFPCWNNYTSEMIGDHSIAFIASAFNKGIRGYNITEAYRLMRKNAFEAPQPGDYADGKGRRALADYLRYGYIPLEEHVPYAFHHDEQVSRTLEYAFDDYSLATIADSLGKDADRRVLMGRARNYVNVIDPSVGLARGRHADGRWSTDIVPDSQVSCFTEGTARQWTFYVPHDVPGLARLMGGRHGLERALDSLFIGTRYNQGNEPDQQAPFMYGYTANPWKTSVVVHRIMRECYSDGPSGLPGNDDAGEISAWYVLASLGIYPVNPVSNDYMLSVPAFGEIDIRLGGGVHLRILCHKDSYESRYIGKLKWNGKPFTADFVDYDELKKGGTLEFYLVNKPTAWGRAKKDQPSGL